MYNFIMKQIIKLKDIADKAGVSINTVSRALRDCSDIGEETKNKIKKIAQELEYVPNGVSYFMRSGKTNLIGIVVSSVTNPYFTICANEIVNKIQKYNYFGMILVSNGVFDKDLLFTLLQNRVCGIISFSDIDQSVSDYCYKNKIPMVLVGIKSKSKGISSLYPDNYYCGQLVGKEFLNQYRNKPCYINCMSVSVNADRRQGFFDVLSSHNIHCDEYNCRFEDGPIINHNVAEQIIQNKNDFIFCFNDEIASVIIDLLDKENYTDYSIFGVDALSSYLCICKKIPSVGADYKYISDRCTDILMKKINHDDCDYQEVYPISLIKS